MTYDRENIGDDEELSRFAVEKNHFRADRSVRQKAFEPQTRQENGNRIVETSTFRTSDLSDSEKWLIGDREVAEKRGKPILARSYIAVLSVKLVGLEVKPIEPPDRHAVIVNWPTDDAEIETKMKELAAAAMLAMRPS